MKIENAVTGGFLIIVLALLNACTAVSSFPTIARAGDTVSIMVGGTEQARKDTISVSLTDSNGIVWDLQALGRVRSVFNLRADAVAKGTHYSSYLESFISWSEGHEPVQTVLVVDLPAEIPAGNAYFTINANVDDNSSGVDSDFDVNIEILPGLGNADNFQRQNYGGGRDPVDFEKLEPASYAKINFPSQDSTLIAAVSLVVDFDEIVVDPADLNVYVPEAIVRGSFVNKGSFGETQRMVYWRQDGDKLFIDIVSPQGITPAFLKVYIVHPDGLTAAPGFLLDESRVYDVNGNELLVQPVLDYIP
ncbi:MAG TPA: hypothetical protein VIQ81_13435 [Gammaproteobacteria bacterium]